MSKVVAVEHLTLDGVYQAPARVDEDPRGGFRHGGWANAGDAAEMQELIGQYMKGGWSLLVGTTTYSDLHEGWQVRQPTHPMTQALRQAQKFVVSRNPGHQLPWANSTLLVGDGPEPVGKLKKDHAKTMIIFGSGVLVRSLMARDLIDEFVLMIHPLVLGQGRRFFDDTTPFTKFVLAHQATTPSGVMMATYHLSADPHQG